MRKMDFEKAELLAAKIRFALALHQRGWKIYGYKANDSNNNKNNVETSNWAGVASKNGFILCIDVNKHNINNNINISYQMNPSSSKWHIEKDGKILLKGNGTSKFSQVPKANIFNFKTKQYKERFRHYIDKNGKTQERIISEGLMGIIVDFNVLLDKFESLLDVSQKSIDDIKSTTIQISTIKTKPFIVDRNYINKNE